MKKTIDGVCPLCGDKRAHYITAKLPSGLSDGRSVRVFELNLTGDLVRTSCEGCKAITVWEWPKLMAYLKERLGHEESH